MNEELQQLKRELEELKTWKRNLESSHSIPLVIDQSLTGRGFLKVLSLTGILKGNGTGAITAVSGESGTFFVAGSSGGSPTVEVTIVDGVITAIV